jgi:virulence-associated protein VapD
LQTSGAYADIRRVVYSATFRMFTVGSVYLTKLFSITLR